jgi:hypothetical protein
MRGAPLVGHGFGESMAGIIKRRPNTEQKEDDDAGGKDLD